MLLSSCRLVRADHAQYLRNTDKSIPISDLSLLPHDDDDLVDDDVRTGATDISTTYTQATQVSDLFLQQIKQRLIIFTYISNIVAAKEPCSTGAR